MKMKMFSKKVLALSLSAVMVFALASCGGSDDKGGADGSDADGVKTLKVGSIGPLTGPAAVYGNAVKNGADIAVEEINEMDGSFKIDYNFQDDEHDPEKSVNAYNNLKDWGLQALVGTVTTTPCIAVAAETYSDRVFQLTPSASSTDVTAGKDNVFQLCFTDPNQGKIAADYMLDHKLGNKIAAIYNNADAYSTGVFNAFKAEMKARGMEVVYEGTFSSDDNADFSVQLNGAKAAGADLVFLPIYYTPASLILAQAKAMEYEPSFFGVDGIDGILALEGFDKTLAEDLILMTPFNPWSDNEDVKSFVSKYKEKYGEIPNQFAADAYDCIYALYHLMVESEAKVDMTSEQLCELLKVKFTENFTYDGLTGKEMKWSTNGEVSKSPVVCVIKDGKYKDIQ